MRLNEQLRPTLNERSKPTQFNVLPANFFPDVFSDMSVENIAYMDEFLEKFRNHEEFIKRKMTKIKLSKISRILSLF